MKVWIIWLFLTFFGCCGRVALDPINLRCTIKDCSWPGVNNWQHIKTETRETRQLDAPLSTPPDDQWILAHKFDATKSYIWLQTPEFVNKFEASCFKFSYYSMAGNQRFNLSLIQNQREYEIWSAGTMNIDEWIDALVPIGSLDRMSFKFEVSGDVGYVGLHAFDFVEDCKVHVCSFQTNDCGCTFTGGFANVPAEKMKNIEALDHSTRSAYGHVAYVNGAPGHQASVFTYKYQRNFGQTCFSFWYMHNGGDVEFVVNALDSQAQATMLWNNAAYTGVKNTWMVVKVNVDFDKYHQVEMQARFKGSGNSSVAIDDLRYDSGKCSLPLVCDFNYNFCNWQQEPTTTSSDSLFFSLGSGRVQNASHLHPNMTSQRLAMYTLAYTDFTLLPEGGSGQMMLLSEYVSPPAGSGCLELNSVVDYLDAADSFSVQAIDLHQSNQWTLWSYDHQATGKGLSKFYISLPAKTDPYRVAIVVKASHRQTLVLLSSIYYELSVGHCNVNTFTTAPTTTSTVHPITWPPKTTLDCDFRHSNLCNWVNTDHKFVFWSESRQATLSDRAKLFLPSHPRRDAAGHSPSDVFIYLLSENGVGVLSSLYVSNQLKDSTFCFSFYYYYYAEEGSELNLGSVNLFTVYADNQNRWLRGMLTVAAHTPETSVSLTFDAFVKKGALALSDFKVTQGACPEAAPGTMFCNFEASRRVSKPECFFQPVVETLKRTWQVILAKDVNEKFVDHTVHGDTGNVYGINFDGSQIPKSLEPTSFEASVKPKQSVGCLRFAYYINGSNLQLGYKMFNQDNQQVVAEWYGRESTEGMWFVHQRTFDLQLARPPSIIFSITVDARVTNPQGGIYIDDVTIDHARCKEADNFCDFELGDYCTMEPVAKGFQSASPAVLKDLIKRPPGWETTTLYLTSYVTNRWLVSEPAKSKRFVQDDATYRSFSGQYLLMPGGAQYDRAIMITQQYDLRKINDYACFSFSYFMPDTASALEVYQSEASTAKKARKLWSLPPSLNPVGWKLASLDSFPASKAGSSVYFYIVGTAINAAAYLAIDDVRIKTGKCDYATNYPYPGSSTTVPPTDVVPSDRYRCADGELIPVAKVCDNVNDCSKHEDEHNCGDCELNHHDLCGYQLSSPAAAAHWNFSDYITEVKIDEGSSITPYFMVATGRAGKATFTSPLINQVGADCRMKFNYFFGQAWPVGQKPAKRRGSFDTTNEKLVGELDVYLHYVDIDQMAKIWQSSAINITWYEWNDVSLDLDFAHQPVHIVFSATITEQFGQSAQFYHAITSVRMMSCAMPKPQFDCNGPDHFKCQNKVCILKSYMCDFSNNCGDNSDEANCDPHKMTSFESGNLNGWRISGDYKLISKVNNYQDFRLAPPIDHTKGTSEGMYILFDNKKTRHNLGELASPPIQTTSDHCFLTFYSMAHKSTTTITVVQRALPNGPDIYLGELNQAGFNWKAHYTKAHNTKTSNIYRFVIKVEIFDSNSIEYVGIDDLALSADCKLLKESDVPTIAPNITTLPPDTHCATIYCRKHRHRGAFTCLKPSQFCDNHLDCRYGQDEANCGNCTFDEGKTCGWTLQADEARSVVIQPANTATGSLPREDGSHSEIGGYLTFESTSGHDMLKMRSPTINANTSEDCAIQLSYVAPNAGELRIRVRQLSSSQVIKTVAEYTRREPQWKNFRFNIGAQRAPFAVEIGYLTNHATFTKGDAAMDNFMLIDCHGKVNESVTNSFRDLNCDFEHDNCGWRSDSRPGWYRVNDAHLAPGYDHTFIDRSLHSPDSGFWLMNPLKFARNPAATLLQSKRSFAPTTKPTCFTFWYVFNGDKANNFSLGLTQYLRGNSRWRTLWERHIPQSRSWTQARVEIPIQEKPFDISFKAQVYDQQTLGLDDIVVTPGECAVPAQDPDCDFELGTCNWKAKGWQHMSGAANGVADHTTGATAGHFMEAEKGATVALTFDLFNWPYLKATQPAAVDHSICLRLWYFLAFNGSTSLLPSAQSQLIVKKMFMTSALKTDTVNLHEVFQYHQANQWNFYAHTFAASSHQSLEIGARIDTSTITVMIDDISLLPHSCEEGGNCDFENDMCGWRNSHAIIQGQSTILWMRYKPRKEDSSGRMKFDHTTGTATGNYLLLNIQSESESRALLTSPIIERRSTKTCLRFAYFGFATTRAKLLQVTLIDLVTGKKVATKNVMAELELGWQQFSATFANLPRAFAFQIQAAYSMSLRTNIGLDDIQLAPGDCHGDVVVSTSTPPPTHNMTSMDCNFEQRDVCAWNYLSSQWTKTRYDAIATKVEFAPRIDHTYGTTFGDYLLYVGKDHQMANVTATTSVTLTSEYCFSFWYYEDGGAQFNLLVSETVAGPKALNQYVLHRVTNTLEVGRWKRVQLVLDNYRNPLVQSSLTISLVPPKVVNDFFIFALDDISISYGDCAHDEHQLDYTFTFEYNLGTLKKRSIEPQYTDMGRIVLADGSSILDTAKKPGYDHTTYTSDGHYFLFYEAFFDTDHPQHLYDIELYAGGVALHGTQSCIRLAYQYQGDNISLALYARADNSFSTNPKDLTLLWQPDMRNAVKVWTIEEIPVNVAFKHQLVFRMSKFGNAGKSFIGLDDINISKRRCYQAINCDFENLNLCTYTPYLGTNDRQKTKTRYDWGIFQARQHLPNKWPGPMRDHTTMSLGGGYLYLTAYRSTFAKIVSSLISGVRKIQTTSYCLSLWTQLTANDVGVRIYILPAGQDTPVKVYEAVDQVPQESWRQVFVNVGQNRLNGARGVQVIIEGELSANSKGAVAIDDVLFEPGACKTDGLLCEDGTQLKPGQVCDFVKDCPSGLDESSCGECNFENGGACGWKNVASAAQFKLVNAKSESMANQIAPKFDGDGNSTGHYFVAYTSGGSRHQWRGYAILNAQQPNMFLKHSFGTCQMQFDYSLDAQGGKYFYIMVAIGDTATANNVVYHVLPDAGYTAGWRRVVVNIGARYSSFTVKFEFTFDNANSMLALDNIKYIGCAFPKPVTGAAQCPVPTDNRLRQPSVVCKQTHYCILADQVCDFRNDCVDGSDEVGCGQGALNCNFESSLDACGIATKKDELGASYRSQMGWRFAYGMYLEPRSSFGPFIDNTYRTISGRYFALLPNQHSSGNDSMGDIFYTRMLTSNPGKACQMRFDYYTDGESTKVAQIHLDIHVRLVDSRDMQTKPVTQIVGNINQTWTRALVEYQSSTPFQFVFYGRQADRKSRLAVDDISFDLAGCAMSKAVRSFTTSTTTTPSPSTSSGHSNVITSATSTQTSVDHPRNHHGPGGAIAAAILVPIALSAIAAYFGYRRYQRYRSTGDNVVLSLSDLRAQGYQ